MEIDNYHTGLLNGVTQKELFHGLVSTVFWGYTSGQNGIFHPERAISKAKLFSVGHARAAAQAPAVIVQALSAARCHLRAGNIGAALLEAMKIKFLGMSFSSKVLMFMDPSKAAVYDSIIAQFLQNCPAEEMRNMAVPPAGAFNQQRRAEAYAQWCAFCSNKALAMNENGYNWSDWDNSQQSWRAVDIERAFFAISGNQPRL
ncbi:MAG: hypothetical protein IVW54_03215 [Candidatus Binataceae bacterium]|nr:hypothetical protein [Candidatus Binataceae bacterium]